MSVKKDYLRKLDEELSGWDGKIKNLEEQVEKATPEDKVEIIDHIERLKTKQKLARKKHEELEVDPMSRLILDYFKLHCDQYAA